MVASIIMCVLPNDLHFLLHALCERPCPLSLTFVRQLSQRGSPWQNRKLCQMCIRDSLCAAGFYDYLDQGAIVAAEWSENFADLLALENPIRVDIQRVDENTRRITIEGVTL